MKNSRFLVKFILTTFSFLLLYSCQDKKTFSIQETDILFKIETENYSLNIIKEGFRYEIKRQDETTIAPAHDQAGIQIGRKGQTLSNVQSTKLLTQDNEKVTFEVETINNTVATIDLWLTSHFVKIQVKPKEEGLYSIVARTSGISPAYGMGDHAAFSGGTSGTRSKVELTGFDIDSLDGDHRMVSNFSIFPQQGLGTVNIEPSQKIARFKKDELTQGSKSVRSLSALYYFIGSPKQIYSSFLDVRKSEGFPVYKPKYEWFGVGWEAYGALAWNTNQKTVTNNIDKYLNLGFPLEWMVVGSGFWPRAEGEMDEHGRPNEAELKSEAKKLLATTSFGMWDDRLYPDPKGMIDNLHKKDLLFTIGLRIGFIPKGPFTDEGIESGYYIENEKGEPELFSVGFPKSDVYLLDAQNPEAVDWYVELCQKWLDYGVDGFKEDLYNYPDSLADDFLNPVNEALMDEGVYIMGRNNYLGSPVDIHRFNDFNYFHIQDRGPINGLAFAYSGFPNVYPDIVGGTGLSGRYKDEPEDILGVYLMRYAQYAALNPSMSFGYGPWNYGDEVTEVTLKAAQLHDRLQPFIYSNAIKSYKTGFPYTITPLPLVYPKDKEVYGLANTTRRSYQWLIGESLLATPLYGNDYAEADSRDVYLPEGKWIEYDSGKIHEGPKTLKNYPLPVGKTPLFVGGTGFVVEEQNGELKGRLYPVSNNKELHFYDKDGETKSTITIIEPDWEDFKIIDNTTGKDVVGSWNRHAYEFNFIPGHDYTIE